MKIAENEQDSPFVAVSTATGFPGLLRLAHGRTAKVRQAIRAYEPSEFLETLRVLQFLANPTIRKAKMVQRAMEARDSGVG